MMKVKLFLIALESPLESPFSELGEMATISAVLYANTNHPELKLDYPNWSDRQKQIYKKWRALSNEKKAPFLQQARDNRTALRMRKNQQVIIVSYVFI